MTGEMILYEEENSLVFRIRVDGFEVFNDHEPFNDSGIENLMKRGAYEIIKTIEPTILVAYHISNAKQTGGRGGTRVRLR